MEDIEIPTSFCGNFSFENRNDSWNTIVFGPCQAIWWSGVPCVFLWICAPLYAWHLAMKATVNRCRDLSLLAVMKLLFGGSMCIINAVEFTKFLYDMPSSGATFSVLAAIPVVQLVTMILCLFLMTWAYKKAVNSSGVFFLFWLLVVIGGIVEVIVTLKSQDEFRIATICLWFSMAVIQLLMQTIADNRARRQGKKTQDEKELLLPKEWKKANDANQKECPAEEASFLNRITYFWLTKLMIAGYTKILVHDDLWNVSKEYTSKFLYSLFEKAWLKGVEKKTLRNKQDCHKTGKGCEKSQTKSPITDRLLLLKSLIKVAGFEFTIGSVIRIISDVSRLTIPFIVGLLVTFVETPEQSMSYGIFLALVLTSMNLLRAFLNQQSLYYNEVTGKKLQTALTCAIFRKSLKLSTSIRKGVSIGNILNLMSVDTALFEDTLDFLHYTWSSPLVATFSTVLIYRLLGVATFMGLAVILIACLTTMVVSSVCRKKQHEKMSLTDLRIKFTSEILFGIKVLKFYAWEQTFMDKLLGVRQKEMHLCKAALKIRGINFVTLTAFNSAVTLSVFGLYVGLSSDNVLDAKKMALALSYFVLAMGSVFMLIPAFEKGTKASIAVTRIAKFLREDELDLKQVTHENSKASVQVCEGGFSWEDNEPIYLKRTNLEVPKGKLVAIAGNVGSGKTSIVSAILGEMAKQEGSVNVDGSIAFIPQQAWILNSSVRDNILLYKDFDAEFYDQVLNTCALRDDLKILPGGDLTEIGEKGVNLSGGQKQRVSLARAVYQDRDIYLLDDPLSALDSHVGRFVFHNVIGPKGILSKKTRILVTHGLQYLPQVDLIYLMKDGTISEHGTYDSLMSRKGAFAEYIHSYLNNDDVIDATSDEEFMSELRRRVHLLTSGSETESGLESISDEKSKTKIVQTKRKSHQAPKTPKIVDTGAGDKSKLIEDEILETGGISASVLKGYAKAFGYKNIGLAGLTFLIEVVALIALNIWLTVWVDGSVAYGNKGSGFYVGVYGAIFLILIIASCFRQLAMIQGLTRASERCHSKLLRGIIRAPMHFFDTTPYGRLLNRFSQDMHMIDEMFSCVNLCLYAVSVGCKALFMVTFSNTIFLAVLVPLAVVYHYSQRFYARSSRQLKRMNMASKSPVYSIFAETLSGVDSIRAYGHQDNFITKLEHAVDKNLQAAYPDLCATRWIGVLVELLVTCVIFITSILNVTSTDAAKSSAFALAITLLIQVAFILPNFVIRLSELEAIFVSVERVLGYSEIESEDDWFKKPEPPSLWPMQGKIEFCKYSTCYRKGLPPVLREVYGVILPSEKIGIVGRTGAGKSTLTGALFRILEPSDGTIFIDGIDITKIGLHQLRSKITIIPQDPVVFSGTLRDNLDPFSKYTNDAVWQSLEDAHLKSFVLSQPMGLLFECCEGGENLSVGQRQLICLARALLRKTKILLLDEATAAVDMETDDLIQTTIRTKFKGCTVLTIAHRLNTILDYDRIMVLDRGKIREFDTPKNLLANKKSIFFSLAKSAELL